MRPLNKNKNFKNFKLKDKKQKFENKFKDEG